MKAPNRRSVTAGVAVAVTAIPGVALAMGRDCAHSPKDRTLFHMAEVGGRSRAGPFYRWCPLAVSGGSTTSPMSAISSLIW